MAQLNKGDRAPTFSLPDQDGGKVKLSDFRGKKLLLYFYPKALTSGCTTQSCAVRDALPDLTAVDATPVGISPDPPEQQAKFDRKHGLGFPLLSDADHSVADSYGVWGEKKMYGRTYEGIVRSAFLIDEEGKVAAALYRVSPKDTVPKIMAALEG
jgi:peroxiredoxin Q/BCP